MRMALVISIMTVTIAWGQPRPVSIVNFSHLDHLMQDIQLGDQKVSIVHIYADYPSYAWTDAGDEGISCVDDAARATIVFLKDFEFRRDSSSLSRACSLLKFLMFMQTNDGQFYNFIRADHSINRDGRTSVKSFGWWAGRGVWAMSLGCRVLKDIEPAFSKELEQCVRRSFPNITSLLQKFGETESKNGFLMPKWLLYDSGSDATTELTLGLIEFYRATEDEQVAEYIKDFARGMMMMQDGDIKTYPYGAHRSWRTMWHSWGNSQSYALAYGGAVLSDTAMIASAEREAQGFYSRRLINGMLKEWDFSDPSSKIAYEQIAYGVRPMTLGLLQLYDVTHKEVYLKMAGLAASWLFGNNVLGAIMYDSSTGRCFDGISDSTHLNRNSGAESTIEALLTLIELERYPVALKYSKYKKVAVEESNEMLIGRFQDDSGHIIILTLDLKLGMVYSRDASAQQ